MSENTCRITILGCGDSAGVPRIGGDWGACDPANPKNRRTRASVMVQSDTTTLVVDTGPDFCIQLTREGIQKVDAVLYTHAHSDHVAGMDDLKVLSAKAGGKIPIYTDAVTVKELQRRFGYLFEQKSEFYPAVVESRIFDESSMGQSQRIGDIDVIPFVQDHGQGNRSLGFRFGDVGYSTDMRGLDEAALSVLKGVRVWIADCADYSRGHGTLHATLPIVQQLNSVIGAPQVYLTHLKVFDDYERMSADLPTGYAPAYDGMLVDYVKK